MASYEVEKRRRHLKKLAWGLSSRVNKKLLFAGFVLTCVNMSAEVLLLLDGVAKGVPLFGVRIVEAFVFTLGVLVGFMIMHRGTERAWL